MSSSVHWKKEPPANAGDYVASIEGNTMTRRHWNGAQWSAPWYFDDPEHIAAQARRTPAEFGAEVRWCEPATVVLAG